jgi:hypothetical protein
MELVAKVSYLWLFCFVVGKDNGHKKVKAIENNVVWRCQHLVDPGQTPLPKSAKVPDARVHGNKTSCHHLTGLQVQSKNQN